MLVADSSRHRPHTFQIARTFPIALPFDYRSSHTEKAHPPKRSAACTLASREAWVHDPPSAIQNLDGADVTKANAPSRDDELLIARKEPFHQALGHPIVITHVMGDAHRVAWHKVSKDP